MTRPLGVAAITLLTASCSSPPPAAAPAPTAEATAAPTAAPVSEEDKPFAAMPTECGVKQGKLCLPPAKFVKRLCSGFYPDVALRMLAKGSPWSRGYLRVKSVEAWNASGGVSSSDKLVFEEEFIILSHREANTGGIQVSGAGGGYDVLRWDGTCASLADEEVMLNVGNPGHAKIPWKSYEDKTRDALLADEKVSKWYTERRKECKGATMGDVSLKCVKADEALGKAVADFVRNKATSLPTPQKMP